MFGKNPIRKQETREGVPSIKDTLWVQEIFHTIQGEGPLTGSPSIFIRLAGCNLACVYCDTDFESSTWHPTIEEIISKVIEVNTSKTNLIVLTGGEPMRQPIAFLIRMLNEAGYQTQIETAGTLWIKEFGTGLYDTRHYLQATGRTSRNTIVCSPKTPKINAELEPYIHAFKYVVRENEISPTDGLPVGSSQTLGVIQYLSRPPADTTKDRIYVQPCDEADPAATNRNIQAAVAICLKYGYRMSLQTHKLLNVP